MRSANKQHDPTDKPGLSSRFAAFHPPRNHGKLLLSGFLHDPDAVRALPHSTAQSATHTGFQ